MKSYYAYRQEWLDAEEQFPSTPIHMDIELSTACNLRCPFCFLSAPKYGIYPEFMRLGDAKAIINQAESAGIQSLKFNWRGEATLSPIFSEVVDYARGKFVETIINTNGNYGHERIGILGALQNINRVAFSVDSFNISTYEKIRKGGSLGRVIENIGDLLSMGHRGVEVRRVICPENLYEDFAGDARRMFGDLVKVEEHHVFNRAAVTSCGYPRKYCVQPARRIVVSVSGDVSPCCVDYFQQAKMGNILKEDIKTIWSRQKEFDKQLRNKVYSPLCRSCSSFSAYDCEEAKCLTRK